MSLLLLYLAISLVFSFLCSVAEAVFLSVNRGYIRALQETRPTAAKRLWQFRDNPEEPLAAILTLNTIAHTVGAAGSGTRLQWCSATTVGTHLGGADAVDLDLFRDRSEDPRHRPLAAAGTGRRPIVKVLVFLLYPLIVAMRTITDQLSHTTSAERSRDEVESTILLAAESEHLSTARVIDARGRAEFTIDSR